MGEKFWVNVEKAMVESVLGIEACEFLISSASNNVSADMVSPPSNLGVQKGLCQLIDGSNWNYAIFWYASSLKSGGSILSWGGGVLANPKGSGAGKGNSIVDGKFEAVEKREEVKKRVLQKLHTCFNMLDGDNYAANLDAVSDVEMFYLTSMYFTFRCDSSYSPVES
ncbi:hypothetical protein P3X46_003061 [Hevea brasiliensis]|uniref:Transcription factor n=1 Tax=Hevea brasiliensis TaxID=3981 RepID=A0ABQ9N7H1_HEVBR|nr:hypothetical protein P3X46_003061 [Hevea brasiliensis]